MTLDFSLHWLVFTVFVFAGLGGAVYRLFPRLTNGKILVTTVIAFIGAVGATYGVSTFNYYPPTTNASELTTVWVGITPGVAYPVVAEGFPASNEIGVFSAFERDTSHGRDVLKAIFTKDDNGVPLELPMDKVSIREVSGAPPTLTLTMDNRRTYGLKQKVHDGPCQVLVRGLLAFCQRVLAYEPAVGDRAKDIGLSAVFRESLDHAVITVPPELRDTILHQEKSG